MQIRFAHRPKEIETTPLDDERCELCGFHAVGDMHSLAGDKARSKIVCSICYNALHVLDADTAFYRVIWAPEIDQANIAHLSRVSALIRRRISMDKAEILKNEQAIRGTKASNKLYDYRNNASDIIKEFNRRGQALDSKFEEHFGKKFMECELSEFEKYASLMSGLRLLPIAFTQKQIDTWVNDDSSLNGYGTSILEEQNWFISDTKASHSKASSSTPINSKELTQEFLNDLLGKEEESKS